MGSRLKECPERTFEVFVEVSNPDTTGTDPEVRRKFPEDYSDQEVLQTLTKFCFPFYVDSVTVSQVGQNFTFVLTDIDSKQRFGFCRLSSGAKSCFCILSYLPWFEVFYKLLSILVDYIAKGQHSSFIVPDPRELPSIPENRNLKEYFVAAGFNNMLHLYASMLHERRILICCSKLSTLTACVHASASMLYPMYWQHVYIPVLPPHLLDYCGAPMPYLIGVHSSLMEKVRNMALDDVVILNADTNTLETPFDDLQSLPNDVVSSLKNRLKKVSTSPGDGVARAFLKAQASLFGSYRNALKIEPGEPITFCEETFVSHRSSAMRQFLQNAIQLQLFKQFIDGRLELLNSGKGFSDIFEDEISMGEYGGSDKMYRQWLLTVMKGSGAIINTVKTRANPAMKTVYKFAKDHAKMGIKEVKNRLKQKDVAENGYTVAAEDSNPRTTPSPLVEKKELKQREDRRPITVHFGQTERVPPPRPPPPKIQQSARPARPPRPHVVKRPKSSVAVDGRKTSVSSPEHTIKPTRHYTVFLSEDSEDEFLEEEDSVSGFSENFLFTPFEWPQPYKTLKESDSADGEEIVTPEISVPSSPIVLDNVTDSLLEDIFCTLGVEPQPLPLSQAKSLEDLRTHQPVEHGTFDYQRMGLSLSDRNRTVPGLKYFHPYNKLWSMGQDDMAIPTKISCDSSKGTFSDLGDCFTGPQRFMNTESLVTSSEKGEISASGQSNITIPRPHGRKTPELGIGLPLPVTVLKASKHQIVSGTGETLNVQTSSNTGSVLELLQEPFGVGNKPLEQEFRQSLNYSAQPPQPVLGSSDADILKPIKVNSEPSGSDDLLSLLDPLTTGDGKSGQMQIFNIATTSVPQVQTNPANFTAAGADFASSSSLFGQQLGYSSTVPVAQFSQSSTNPFIQTVPAPFQIPIGRPGGHFAHHLGLVYNSNAITSSPGFFQPQRNFSAPSLSNLFSQPTLMSQTGPFLQQSQNPSQTMFGEQAALSSTSSIKPAMPVASVAPKAADSKPTEPPLLPPKFSEGLEEGEDPFESLLNKTKQEVAPTRGKVEQLRKKWETFE
ncbi:DENN domain-containing protein 1A isoform X2 [Latimeria chalumnae]|uniref:DENN domain-containing protein 1A isoform X2 n=1 Tax=Latimeria chalumnae TaxID=7897 RepID=UPI00313E8579